MPGIAGIITNRPDIERRHVVASMVASMQHEPFYGSGMFCSPEAGVCVGWTAHPHSYAHRAMTAGGAGSPLLAFSGECFGSERTDIDIRALYERTGDRFVEELNGLFSGLLVDVRRRRALLFNDRYGIERLYVYETDGATYFASEAKALLRVVPALRAFDERGVAQFLTFGCTLGEQTLFQGVRLLEPGSLWSFQNSECRKRRYFSPETWASLPPLTPEAFQEELAGTLGRIVPRYVGTGSEIGISLTGGLDSRMIMACLPRVNRKPVCYTFSGLEGETRDDRLARRVATACQLQHHLVRIGPDFLTAYGEYVDRTVYVTDGCSGALGAHEIYLNARARQLGTVRVTGNFGSEVLRSISTLRPIHLARELFPADINLPVDSLSTVDIAARHPVTFAAFCDVPWSLFGNLAAGRSQVVFRTPYLDNELVALAFRAPFASRRSAAPSQRVVTKNHPGLENIPTDRMIVGNRRGIRHHVGRAWAEATFKLDYLHKEGMPSALSRFDAVAPWLSKAGLLGQHKYLAYRPWFRRELAPYVREVLADARTSRSPYWNREFLATAASDHISGRHNYLREIGAVLTLEAVDRLLLRGSAAPEQQAGVESDGGASGVLTRV